MRNNKSKVYKISDEVIFFVKEEKLTYNVGTNFLYNVHGRNSTIFDYIGISNEDKRKWASEIYGVRAGGSGFPTCEPGNMEQLNKLITAIYEKIEENEGIFELW